MGTPATLVISLCTNLAFRSTTLLCNNLNTVLRETLFYSALDLSFLFVCEVETFHCRFLIDFGGHTLVPGSLRGVGCLVGLVYCTLVVLNVCERQILDPWLHSTLVKLRNELGQMWDSVWFVANILELFYLY